MDKESMGRGVTWPLWPRSRNPFATTHGYLRHDRDREEPVPADDDRRRLVCGLRSDRLDPRCDGSGNDVRQLWTEEDNALLRVVVQRLGDRMCGLQGFQSAGVLQDHRLIRDRNSLDCLSDLHLGDRPAQKRGTLVSYQLAIQSAS